MPTLRNLATSKCLFYGAASKSSILGQDTAFSTAFTNECGALTAEADTTWKHTRPTSSTFDYTKTDWLQNYAKVRGMLFRGHCLCWHDMLPPWFATEVNASNAQFHLQYHISNLVGRYAGKVHSWDVVNEAVLPTDGMPNGLRNSNWYQFLGEGYIETAFRAAAAADPNAMLIYNDYSLEYNYTSQDNKRAAVLGLLTRLKNANVPIHALGIQAHLNGSDPGFSATKFSQFLSDVAALGLKIVITEMDVIDQNLPADVATRDSLVANCYRDFLTCALAQPAVIGLQTWGLSDKYTWLSTFRPRADGLPVRPLPLDDQYYPKLAYNAIADALNATFVRT